jgi:hypothetical protein
MKVCNTCHTEKPLDRFEQFKRGGKKYHKNCCRECSSKKRDAREIKKYGSEEAMREHRRLKSRKTNLKKHYGLEWDEYLQMIEDQGHQCSICGCDLKIIKGHRLTACVDHCHKSGKIRGILCNSCNAGIGQLQDDPALVQSALNYLLKHRGS